MKNKFKIGKLLAGLHQIDINLPNDNSLFPLLIVCYCGNLELLKLLLNRPEIDINQSGCDGKLFSAFLECKTFSEFMLSLL